MGFKHSEETKQRMREIAKRRPKPSAETREKIAAAKRGANNPKWLGGRFIDGDGYVRILMPGHPMAFSKYAHEHRIVMANHIGRMLDGREHVHHINGNRADNRIENLQIMTAADHCAEHSTGRRHPNRKGRQWTAAERAKISAWAKGRKQTPEAKAKQSAGMRAAWARKRGD